MTALFYGTYKPHNNDEILRSDKNVLENWQTIKQGFSNVKELTAINTITLALLIKTNTNPLPSDIKLNNTNTPVISRICYSSEISLDDSILQPTEIGTSKNLFKYNFKKYDFEELKLYESLFEESKLYEILQIRGGSNSNLAKALFQILFLKEIIAFGGLKAPMPKPHNAAQWSHTQGETRIHLVKKEHQIGDNINDNINHSPTLSSKKDGANLKVKKVKDNPPLSNEYLTYAQNESNLNEKLKQYNASVKDGENVHVETHNVNVSGKQVRKKHHHARDYKNVEGCYLKPNGYFHCPKTVENVESVTIGIVETVCKGLEFQNATMRKGMPNAVDPAIIFYNNQTGIAAIFDAEARKYITGFRLAPTQVLDLFKDFNIADY